MLEHLGAAEIDALVECGALGAEADAKDAITLDGIAAVAQQVTHGPGGSGADLYGADQFRRIVGMDAGGGFRVEAAQQTPQGSGAMAAAQPFAQPLVTLRPGE